MTIVLWLLWRPYKDIYYGAVETVQTALEDAEWWGKSAELVAEERDTQRPSNKRDSEKWKPPLDKWFKCNSDGTCRTEESRSGLGWILRDNRGVVKWMGAKSIQRTKTVEETELEALRWAVLAMHRLGYHQVVIFESDSLEVVKAINGDTHMIFTQTLVNDIRNCKIHKFYIIYE